MRNPLIKALRRGLIALRDRRVRDRKPRGTQRPHATWLWVVREDRRTALEVGDRGWWTCRPGTREGDLALVYRTAPDKDIAYLVQATSDPVGRAPDDGVASSLPTACDYVVVARFTSPLRLSEIRADPSLEHWSALRTNFRGGAHRVPDDVWQRLLQRLGVSADAVLGLADQALFDYWFERDIEYQLVREPARFGRAGYSDIADVRRQKHFSNGRIADLILTTSAGGTVVVELKRGRVTLDAVRQLETYRQCQHEEAGGRRPPPGLLVGAELTTEAQAALRQLSDVRFVPLQQLGFRQLPERPPSTRLDRSAP